MKNKIPRWEDTTEIENAPKWDDTTEIDDISQAESGIKGFVKGVTLGFAPAIAGVMEAAGSTVGLRGMGGKFEDTRLESDREDEQSLIEIYRQGRDAKRQDYEAAQKANPGTFTTGEVGGGITTAFVPGLGALNAAKGAGVATVMGKGALQAGIYGLGDSKADLTKGEFVDAAVDTAKSAALGAAGAGLIHGASKGVGYVGDKIADTKAWQRVEEWVSSLPEAMQKKAREKAVEALNPILSQQERLETSGRLDKVGQELLDNNILQGKSGLPTGIKGIYNNLQNKTKEVGQEVGAHLQEAQDVFPELRWNSDELAAVLREKAVEPNAKTAFWKGANAVGAEADQIESWNKKWTLPELNQYKSELGKRIKTWGNDNLSDKKVYEDMYNAVNGFIEDKVNKLGQHKVVGEKLPELLANGFKNVNDDSKIAQFIESTEEPIKSFKKSKNTYGALEDAEKIAKKASARESKNNDIGLTTWLAALTGTGYGLATGDPTTAIATTLGAAGARGVARAYGNQTMAILLNKLSKAGPSLAKYSGVLSKYASESPKALGPALYVLAKNDPEFKQFLNDNPPDEKVNENSP